VLEDVQLHQLFGGAVEMAFPQRLIDVSDFRPVPDHQEVYADGGEDQSLIVEVLEHQSLVEDADAPQHFFRDLVAQNEASTSHFDGNMPTEGMRPSGLPEGASFLMASGTQVAAKGRQQGPAAHNHIQVLLAVIRLPQHGTDIVVSLNSPIHIVEGSAAAADAGAGPKQLHATAPQLFHAALSSLRIKDYGLFGA